MSIASRPTLKKCSPERSFLEGATSDWLRAHPTTAVLAVEVIISSAAVDEQKADIYAEAGISEYWLVRPENRTVEVFRKPTSDGYLSRFVLTDADTLSCESLPEGKIPVADILPARP
jgi:Uma2 family endonuclease